MIGARADGTLTGNVQDLPEDEPDRCEAMRRWHRKHGKMKTPVIEYSGRLCKGKPPRKRKYRDGIK